MSGPNMLVLRESTAPSRDLLVVKQLFASHRTWTNICSLKHNVIAIGVQMTLR